VTQALHVANGDTIYKKLSHAQSRISKALSSNKSTDELIDDAFLSGLSRPPTTVEREQFSQILGNASGDKDKRIALEDAHWAILSSREFLFNH
jgi:hypothetical protein